MSREGYRQPQHHVLHRCVGKDITVRQVNTSIAACHRWVAYGWGAGGWKCVSPYYSWTYL
eukprot:44115-Eustigmatos_ZCMA.PRE.1